MPQPFSSQNLAGVPQITHDPISVLDLLVVEVIDTSSPDYQEIDYGTTYGGYVDPASGATLYSEFVLVDIQSIDHQYKKRIYQSLPGSWVTESGVDTETEAVITQKKRKNIPANITPSVVVSGGFANVTGRTDINVGVAWETKTVISATINSRTEYETAEFNFPTLVFGISGSVITALDGQDLFYQNINQRPAFRRPANYKTVITYSTTAQSVPSEVVGFKTNSLIHQGAFWSINLSDVLNDGFFFQCTTGSNNPAWGVVYDPYTAAASSPLTASGYVALIGTWYPIGFKSTPWKIAGFYRNEEVYIQLQ